jgi:hypothetical protein
LKLHIALFTVNLSPGRTLASSGTASMSSLSQMQ